MDILGGLKEMSGASRAAKRLSSVLGADTPTDPIAQLAKLPPALPPHKPSSISDWLKNVGNTAQADIPDGIGTFAGAGVGAYFWPGHRVLGAIGGASLGRNVPALVKGDRTLAARNLGVTFAGIAGSRVLPVHPVLGFLIGSVGAGIVAHVMGVK